MRTPTQGIDYTSRDYEAFRELLIQKLQEKMPEYTDTSETDAGIVILEALANGLDILSMYADITANDVLLPTTQDRKLAVLLARCLGYTPYHQTAAIHEQVFVLEEIQDEDVVIPQGTIVKTEESADLTELQYETMEDLVIPAGALGNEKDVNDNYLYTVFVEQGETIEDDVLGTSNGTPMQKFDLDYTEVLVDSIELYVDEGEGFELWEKVDNFLECNDKSKCYCVSVDEFDTCTIEFGNGIKGKVPLSVENGIVANYRIGGGDIGNVSENIITEMDEDIEYVDETFNVSIVERGHDKESLESIKQNAPATYRTRNRLVTLQDYKDLLKRDFYDFMDIRVVRDTQDKKKVLIYYMMKVDYTFDQDLADEVDEYISSRSMVGTSYVISEYVGEPVDMEISLIVDDDYDKDKILDLVEVYIESVIFEYGALGFGDSLVKSDVESEVKGAIEGILSLRITDPISDIIKTSADNNVLTKGTIVITALYLSEVD